MPAIDRAPFDSTLFVLALIVGPAIASYVLILVLKPLLQRYALAKPNARSSHSQPTPQGAGIAVIAVTAATIALLSLTLSEFETGTIIPVLASVVILAIVGAVDDVKTLEVFPRLAIQSLAALIVTVTFPDAFHILPGIPIWFERALLFLALLWFVNLTNFMDGIDWMTVVEVVPLTAAIAIFGYLGALSMSATLVALGLCGAMLGFAPLNRPVARVFLGDVGSLPIGMLVGWLLILLAQTHLAAALLLPLYYLADATVTLLRRLKNGERVFHAHRGHFYQRALINGQSVTSITGQVLLLNIALIVLAGLTIAIDALPLHIVAVSAGVILVGWQLHRFARTYN